MQLTLENECVYQFHFNCIGIGYTRIAILYLIFIRLLKQKNMI